MDLDTAQYILRQCYISGYLRATSLYPDSVHPMASIEIRLSENQCAGFPASDIINAIQVISEWSLGETDLHYYEDAPEIRASVNPFLENGFEQIGLKLEFKKPEDITARLAYYFQKGKGEVTADGKINLKDLSEREKEVFAECFKTIGIDSENISNSDNGVMTARLNEESIISLAKARTPWTASEVRLYAAFRKEMCESGAFLILPNNYRHKATGKDDSYFRNIAEAVTWSRSKNIFVKDGQLTVKWTPSFHENAPEARAKKIHEVKAVLKYLTGTESEPEVNRITGRMLLGTIDTSVPTLDYTVSVPFTDKAAKLLEGFISTATLEANAPSPKTSLLDIKIEKIGSDVAKSLKVA